MDLYSYFYSLVRQIPDGMVCSYKDLAVALGDPISARAVGEMLSENPDPVNTECFRVVHNDGSVGNFTHPLGAEEKVRRLRNDGIDISHGMVGNFEQVRFTGFRSDFPLKKIADEQRRMSEHVDFGEHKIGTIGAVDVSYSRRQAFAALVWHDGGKLLSRFYTKVVNFPYIPTYLSYREGELMVGVLKDFDGAALIDGQGIYHPRYCGLASFVGLERENVTIGIGKSKLGGTVTNGIVMIDSKALAGFVDGRYVSPGNMINLDSALKLFKSNPVAMELTNEAHKAATYFRDISAHGFGKM